MPKFKVGQRVRRLSEQSNLEAGAIVYVVHVGSTTIDVSRARGSKSVTVKSGDRPMHFAADQFEAVGTCGTDKNRKLLLC